MRKITKVVTAFAFSMALAGAAWAGARVNEPVAIDTAARWARGALGTARNSTDTLQMIGCYTAVNTAGVAPTVYCQARTANSVSAACRSTNPDFVQVVHGLNGDSNLLFRWDANGTCTEIVVHNVSHFPPKNP